MSRFKPEHPEVRMTMQDTKFYGWFLIGVFFCIYFLNSTFPYYGASVINTYMAKSLNLDKTTLGLGFSIFSVSLAVTAPVAGFSVNRIGTRFTLFIGGGLIMLGALIMSSMVVKPWQYLVVFGIITGTGVSMGGVIPIQAGVTFWFKKHKAIAMSIVLSAAGFGGLVAAPLLNRVIAASGQNWKTGWIVVAATSMLAAVLSAVAVRSKPEDMGQVPDGRKRQDGSLEPSSPGKIYQSALNWETYDALGTKALWLIIFASISFLTPYVTCVAHGVVHLQALGHSEAASAMSVGFLVFFSIIGRVVSGFLGDRVELRIIWSAALCLVGAGMVVLAESARIGAVSIYLYALLVGTGMGAAYVCMATIVGNYFGANSFASMMGLIFPITFLFAALGPYLAGFMYDRSGTYVEAFFGLSILAFVGVIMMWFAKPPERRRIL